MAADWRTAILGRTGVTVCRLGMSSSYGMPAAALERAFERGANYFYWGSLRKDGFAEGLRNLARRREQFVLVVQSYAPAGWMVRRSLEKALRRLGFDYADVLLLGMWGRPVPPRILDAVAEMKRRGLVRFLGVSTHKRPLAAQLAHDPAYDILHIRYNAVHTGAERDIFPHLPENPPGIVAYTATSWRQLLGHRRIPKHEKVPTAGDCYRFVLSNPAVDVCMTGAADMEQTEHALDALDRGPLSEEEMDWMRRLGRAIYGKR